MVKYTCTVCEEEFEATGMAMKCDACGSGVCKECMDKMKSQM